MTKQTEHWAGKNGDAYVDRNPRSTTEMESLYREEFGMPRSAMNTDFLGDLDKELSILEVGANVGVQLELLRQQGFRELLGIDINRNAIAEAKKLHPEVKIQEASGLEMPFEDNSFDLVYTSGVLIHIAPQDIARFISEMHRVSRKYLWGFEYYAPEYTEILYRGERGLMWKTDFAALFLSQFSDLKKVKEKTYTMPDGNINQMFLLEKT